MTPKNRLRIFTIFTLLSALTVCIFLVGTNTKILIIPVTMVTEGESNIGQNIDAALICGIAMISVLNRSPLTFVASLSVILYYPENIHKRQFTFLAFNFANVVLAGCFSYITLLVLDTQISDPYYLIAIKILAAAFTFNLVNYFVLAVSYIVEGEHWKELLEDSRKALIEVLPLSLFCGCALQFIWLANACNVRTSIIYRS